MILACRNKEKGQAAVDRIIAETGNTNVSLRLVDLSVMKSVRQFAENFVKEEERLDILVNNAGLSGKVLHDVAPRSNIMPWLKIDRPLV